MGKQGINGHGKPNHREKLSPSVLSLMGKGIYRQMENRAKVDKLRTKSRSKPDKYDSSD